MWKPYDDEYLKENFIYFWDHIPEAEAYFKKRWAAIACRGKQLTGIRYPEKKYISNPKCSMYLGVYIAERVLSHIFVDVTRMPITHPGYDFICSKGYKIDVKSSCLGSKSNSFNFSINNNTIADYFLLLGFDNRTDLNPLHMWLIKSNEMVRYSIKISDYMGFIVKNIPEELQKYLKYELPYKIFKIIEKVPKFEKYIVEIFIKELRNIGSFATANKTIQ